MSIKKNTDYWLDIYDLIPKNYKKKIDNYYKSLINKPSEYFDSYYGWINFRSILIINLPETNEKNYIKFPWLKQVVDIFNEGIEKFNQK